MGRGLSELQKRILDALKDGEKVGRMSLSPLIYGEHPTRTQIVDLSRAINRLEERGLINIFCDRNLKSRHAYSTFLLQISPRGVKYLKGEKLPQLETVRRLNPADHCWCGVPHGIAVSHRVPKSWKVINQVAIDLANKYHRELADKVRTNL
jgi:hypothetical protein